jgi:hypothetical protein
MKLNGLKLLRWFGVSILSISALIGYGYYNHLYNQSQRANSYSNNKLKIEPIEACSLFLSLNDSIALYSKYKGEIYECYNSFSKSSEFGDVKYIHKASGLANAVYENELSLTVIDKRFTTQKTNNEIIFDEDNKKTLYDLFEILINIYSSESDKKLEFHVNDLINNGNGFEMDKSNFKIKGEKININNGRYILKIYIISK